MPSPKIALITGAGTGVGKAAALALAKEGFSVVLTGRRKELLEEVATEAQKLGAKTLVVAADVGDPAQVKALFAKTKETFGRLDLLFNNAGMGAPAVPMEQLPFETWKAVVDVNLTGSFLCAQEAMRMMKEQKPQGSPSASPWTAGLSTLPAARSTSAMRSRRWPRAWGRVCRRPTAPCARNR
jgi:NAD(P)-dependent dehydrogenase (short-subunit alcohol dehydrogenase family)